MQTSQERVTALLQRGYFPKELPPSFTTRDFGSHAAALLTDWEAGNIFKREKPRKVPGKPGRRKSRSYTYSLKDAEAEIISVPKRGYERRNVHITHPVPQALLTKELAESWATISKWLARSRFSLDRSEVGSQYARDIKAVNFEAHHSKKAYIEASADWTVRTDITRFYPSIYTHSISWAAYGKERVKRDRDLYQGSLADRLDVLVRACNRNQTIGIPIGPETSRIIADIISACVDSTFQGAMPSLKQAQADRLQDDWFVGVDSLKLAEDTLSAISETYRLFGLEINGSKTALRRTIAPSAETWISEINAFLSHRPGQVRGSRLRELLALTLRLQLDNPKDSVVSYTLSVLERNRAGLRDAGTLESFLIRAAAIAPGSSDRICNAIVNLQADTRRVSLERVRVRFTELIERYVSRGELYEAIWLTYALRGLKVPLRSRNVCSAVYDLRSSALGLVLLDMKSKGLCPASLPVDKWERIEAAAIVVGPEWLLAYEGIRNGWLRDRNRLMSHPFFKAMYVRGVRFYDPRRNVARTDVLLMRRRLQQRQTRREALRLISDLRGFTFGDYE